jgi:hypothetical protein
VDPCPKHAIKQPELEALVVRFPTGENTVCGVILGMSGWSTKPKSKSFA